MTRTDDLRPLVTEYLERGSLAELASEIGVSRTALSLWYNGKYKSDPKHLEEKLRPYLTRQSISRKDERILGQIEELLQSAENRQAITTIISLRS